MDRAPASLFGEMHIMDSSGHKQLIWHTDNPDELATAKKTFDQLIGNGYSAFASEQGTTTKRLIGAFDPAVKDMIMVPRNVGG